MDVIVNAANSSLLDGGRVDGASEAEVRTLLSNCGIPLTDAPADHIGTLLLAASWLGVQSAEDESQALETLLP